jgi:hypothetical protein
LPPDDPRKSLGYVSVRRLKTAYVLPNHGETQTVAKIEDVVIELLSALQAEWETHLTHREIGSDVDKIELLNHVREVIDPRLVEVPKATRKFYEGVYLRDVWSSENS